MEWKIKFHGSKPPTKYDIYIYTYIVDFPIRTSIETSIDGISIYIYIWVNHNISLTWIKAHLGMISLINYDSRVRSQWGRYNLPRYIYIYIPSIFHGNHMMGIYGIISYHFLYINIFHGIYIYISNWWEWYHIEISQSIWFFFRPIQWFDRFIPWGTVRHESGGCIQVIHDMIFMI